MYFLDFQSEDMLKLGLNFNKTWPTYACKRYPYIKKSACVTTNKMVPQMIKLLRRKRLQFKSKKIKSTMVYKNVKKQVKIFTASCFSV